MFLIIVAKIRIMLCKTRGIVLHTIPYNDKYSIIYMYTEAFGRASYLVSRSRGKKSTVSKALFIPLSVLEMEVEHLNKRDLHRIKETRICFPLNDVCCDPVKNVLALFLSEVLFRVVKDTEPDPRLFDYLYESIHLLEYADKGIANFHMVFLLGLLHHLGIFPNMESHRVGYYFDMLNGVFTDHIPMHRLSFPVCCVSVLRICRFMVFPGKSGPVLFIVFLSITVYISRIFRKSNRYR